VKKAPEVRAEPTLDLPRLRLHRMKVGAADMKANHWAGWRI